MKTFIVPTDFSDTAKNAAQFAVSIAAQNEDTQIILYNSFEKKYADRINIMIEALEELKQELLIGHGNVQITCMAEEESSFTTGLERIARHQSADMIIMGITGAAHKQLSQTGSAGNTHNDRSA